MDLRMCAREMCPMIHGLNLGYETGRKTSCNGLEETGAVMLCVTIRSPHFPLPNRRGYFVSKESNVQVLTPGHRFRSSGDAEAILPGGFKASLPA